MKITLILGFIIFLIDALCLYYIQGLGGSKEATNSGLLGEVAVFIVFFSVGVYIPTLLWMLVEGKK
ncbi:hypothetical protein BZ160_08590 [Pantoea vagans]|nr:hypothetical protein [Pantoea vagans]OQV41831.1 hypothetical protein BZ160_08590 [Pantoea vagans]